MCASPEHQRRCHIMYVVYEMYVHTRNRVQRHDATSHRNG